MSAVLQDVEEAKNILLNEMIFFGLTERYNDTLRLVREIFNWPFITEEKHLRQHAEYYKIEREDLSKEDEEFILHHNQLDKELFEWALAVFDHRIKLFDRYRNGEFDGHLHDEKH
jgi:hypothetical protein